MKRMIPAAMSLLFLVFWTQAFSADKRVAVPIGNSPSMGPEHAPVTIVEFVDFQ